MKNLHFIPVLGAIFLILTGCGQNSEGNSTPETPGPPQKLTWTSSNDIDLKPGQRIQFEGYLNRAWVSENNEVSATFTSRHNSGLKGGEISIDLTNHPLLAGFEEITPTEGMEPRDRPDWKLILANGDTLRTDFLNRSKVFVQGVNERDYSDALTKFYEIKPETLYAIEPTIEQDYQKAVPLTSELAQKPKPQEDQFTYCYLEGEIDLPNSVNGGGSRSYSFTFKEAPGFYNIMFLPIFIGDGQCGKTARLVDGYYDSSVKFWDANLNTFGCNTKIRIYGLWEARFQDLLIEEFVVLESDTTEM